MKKRLLIVICFILLFGFGIFKLIEENSNNSIPLEKNIAFVSPSVILVSIKGEVRKPGIYTLNKGSRIEDLIKAAGGLTKFADEENINYLKVLVDSDEVIISRLTKQTNLAKLININTASSIELQTLDGIGQAKAQAIITYRNDYGNFKQIDELLKVPGITSSIYERIKNYITC